jgi:hypothetical protein
MKKRGIDPGTFTPLATVVLGALFLVACNQTTQTPSGAAAAPAAASAEPVFIQFDGPWAFAPDPKDANSVLAIAPNTKGHQPLYVKASNQSLLAAGIYDLSLPARSGAAAGAADASIAQAKIDAPSLQRALTDKSNRYVIRIPKPEAYVVAARARSRVGSTYPPDASTEKDYATAVSLRYTVISKAGFSLGGTPDSGAFNPLLLQVETPIIRFVIEPAQQDDPADKCSLHSREGFRDLTKLLGLTLYVDYPGDPSACQKNDPQKGRSAHAHLAPSSALERMVAVPRESQESREMQMASVAGDGGMLDAVRLAAIYLFARPVFDCKAPILLLTVNP